VPPWPHLETKIRSDCIRRASAVDPGRGDYRVLVGVGVLVQRFAVVGQLAPDGAVELIRLDIDLQSDP
jgi:hypothetical protein